MGPYRSMLFVPGHKPSWVAKGVASGADALILDLEDSVPEVEKVTAREAVARSVHSCAAQDDRPGLWVRPNGLDSGLSGADLDKIVQEGVDGLLLPMVYGPDDVIRWDALIEYFERRAGLPFGTVRLIVCLETAEAIASCEQLAGASPRVASLLSSTARDGDVARSLGYEFTPEGVETLYVRSRAVLACRAAGMAHPICGVWQDLADEEGLRAFARQNRQLGFRGQAIIHPSHARVVNESYTLDDDQIAYYEGMVAAFEAAQRAGQGAVAYRGDHIDAAHIKTARDVLSDRRRLDD